jgi:hypothetical protein
MLYKQARGFTPKDYVKLRDTNRRLRGGPSTGPQTACAIRD